MNLYELTQEELRLQNLLSQEERTEEEEADLCAMFDDLAANKEAKADGYIKVARNIQSNIDSVEAEIKRLSHLNDKRKKELDNLKKRVILSLQTLDQKSLEGTLGKFIMRGGKKKVNIINENDIPVKYMRSTTTVVPDKAAIADAIKYGNDVPGCELVDGDYGLEIK